VVRAERAKQSVLEHSLNILHAEGMSICCHGTPGSTECDKRVLRIVVQQYFFSFDQADNLPLT
jgi:hypothetical protein